MNYKPRNVLHSVTCNEHCVGNTHNTYIELSTNNTSIHPSTIIKVSANILMSIARHLLTLISTHSLNLQMKKERAV